ncbi:MAG: hypothetical protein JEZ06_09585 [Anaerolineaceae bacterium]|nr:hypothetical protein [Anaerolineaceae bacterium]
MSRSIKVLFLLGLVLTLTLTACGAPAVEAVEEPAVEPAEIALKITGSVANEMAWTEDEVKAMDSLEVESENKDGEMKKYTGVLISTLLGEAKPDGATALVFVADDGYSAEVTMEEFDSCTDCIVSFRSNGGFSSVLPDFSTKLQVKGLVEIQVK